VKSRLGGQICSLGGLLTICDSLFLLLSVPLLCPQLGRSVAQVACDGGAGNVETGGLYCCGAIMVVIIMIMIIDAA